MKGSSGSGFGHSGSFRRSGSFRLLERLPEEGRQLPRLRWSLLVTAVALAVVGVLTIHSASAELSFDHAPRQASWVGLGLLAAALVLAIDYRRLAAVAWTLYLGSIGLLVLVLLVGRVGGGARSWLGIGPFGFQPSELAKLTTVLLLARLLAGGEEGTPTGRRLLTAVVVVGMPMALLARQPDLGGAAMFVPVLTVMVVVSGVRWRVLALAGAAVLVLGGAAFWLGLKDYQRERIRTFVSPERDPLGAGYQVRQSKIAVGSGGLGGRGYMQGTQSQLRFLPARHTDFVFAVLAEERGFLGVAGVLALFTTYLASALEVARRARDRLGILLVAGYWSFFAAHVLYNTAMVVGLVPITGIPLPFLSYGGSFTLYNFVVTGLILGIDYRRYVNR